MDKPNSGLDISVGWGMVKQISELVDTTTDIKKRENFKKMYTTLLNFKTISGRQMYIYFELQWGREARNKLNIKNNGQVFSPKNLIKTIDPHIQDHQWTSIKKDEENYQGTW